MSTFEDDDDGPMEVIQRPVARFRQLPRKTREWLEKLDEDDIDLLIKAIRFYNRAEAVAGFFKWFWIVVLGAFLGGVGLWEAILKFLAFLKTGLPK